MSDASLIRKLYIVAQLAHRKWGLDPTKPTVEDLVSVGWLAAQRAFARLDSARAKPWTYAKRRVSGAMFDHLCRESAKTSPPGHHGRRKPGRAPLPQMDHTFDVYAWGAE